MPSFVLPAPAAPTLDVLGSDSKFPVRSVYCIGRNYLDHIREMKDDERDPPIVFMKPSDAVVANGGDIAYPLHTSDLHFECELVVALKSGGTKIPTAAAARHIYGHAVGIDLTRRDHQPHAIAKGLPWEVAKSFDRSAPIGPLSPVEDIGVLSSGSIELRSNGELRQSGDLAQMIWTVDDIIAKLSEQYCLMPGDIIMTGTPAGVGRVNVGDVLDCRIQELAPMQVRIQPRASGRA